VDTAAVIIKDPKTKKMVRVSLTETEADSALFSGVYSISWKEVQSSNPEIYAVPPDQGSQKIDISKLNQLKRLPYIFKKDENDQSIEAFSTREEAVAALEKYKTAQKQKLRKSEQISESLIEIIELTKKQNEENQRIYDVQKRDEERQKSIESFQKQVGIFKENFNELSPKEQTKRKAESSRLVKEAMEQLKAANFEQAEEKFKQALDHYPGDDDTFFYYGITSYKLNKFNDSLIFLESAQKGKFNPTERDFYKALDHFRLEEYEKSLAIFENIKGTKDKIFAPTSAFYEGIIKMKLEKYDEAKNHFQEVLDTSSDPALDQSAEDYVEKIERIKQFLAEKAKKIFLTGSLGLQYDSNVLIVSSSSADAGDPSKVGDYRYITGGSIEYRPLYEPQQELSVKARGDLIYSSKGDNVTADPLLYTLKAPYKYKSQVWKRGYKLELTPGYEMLYLDKDSSGAEEGYFKAWREKDDYLKSVTFDVSNNLVMSDSHIMGVNIKYRNDQSESKTAVGDSNPSAQKWTLEWQNIYFLNQRKDWGLIGTLGYSDNRADGKNLTYKRLDASAMALFPVGWEFKGVGGLSYYQSNYPDKSTSRVDDNITAKVALARPLYDWLNLSLIGSYTDNRSTSEVNAYNKYSIMSVLTADWAF